MEILRVTSGGMIFMGIILFLIYKLLQLRITLPAFIRRGMTCGALALVLVYVAWALVGFFEYLGWMR